MKLKTSLILFFLVFAFASNTVAQDGTSAAEKLDKLRLQLSEVQAKEGELRIRLQQLEEDLKPENIERSLAGIGSTKPEELREHRRRQLTIEKDSVLAQLKILETSRSRLESAIATAEAQAYQESAGASPAIPDQMRMAQHVGGPRWLVIGTWSLVITLIIGVVILLMRRK